MLRGVVVRDMLSHEVGDVTPLFGRSLGIIDRLACCKKCIIRHGVAVFFR
jgi:hypothetical protein